MIEVKSSKKEQSPGTAELERVGALRETVSAIPKRKIGVFASVMIAVVAYIKTFFQGSEVAAQSAPEAVPATDAQVGEICETENASSDNMASMSLGNAELFRASAAVGSDADTTLEQPVASSGSSILSPADLSLASFGLSNGSSVEGSPNSSSPGIGVADEGSVDTHVGSSDPGDGSAPVEEIPGEPVPVGTEDDPDPDPAEPNGSEDNPVVEDVPEDLENDGDPPAGAGDAGDAGGVIDNGADDDPGTDPAEPNGSENNPAVEDVPEDPENDGDPPADAGDAGGVVDNGPDNDPGKELGDHLGPDDGAASDEGGDGASSPRPNDDNPECTFEDVEDPGDTQEPDTSSDGHVHPPICADSSKDTVSTDEASCGGHSASCNQDSEPDADCVDNPGATRGDISFGTSNPDLLLGDVENDILYGAGGDDVIAGNQGDDLLVGADGVDTLDGGAGNDRISGGHGADSLYGREGDDILSGGSGDDILWDGQGSDRVFGGSGNDTIYLADDGDADHLDGGQGVDTIDLSNSGRPAFVDLDDQKISWAEGQSDTFEDIEIFQAGAGAAVFDISGFFTPASGVDAKTVFQIHEFGQDDRLILSDEIQIRLSDLQEVPQRTVVHKDGTDFEARIATFDPETVAESQGRPGFRIDDQDALMLHRVDVRLDHGERDAEIALWVTNDLPANQYDDFAS